MIRLFALRRSPPNSVLVRWTSGQRADPKMSSHHLRQKSSVSNLERMGWLCEQVWKQLNSVQLWQYHALAPRPSCSANSGLERQQAPQSTGETALMIGQTALSSSSWFLPFSEVQKASRLPYCIWKTMASDQQNMNSRVLSFSAPNMPWKTSLFSLRLCCQAYSVTVRMASTQKGPLRLAERKICSSKSRKSSTVSTTALDAIAPTVRCGYLALNQAESAPGQEPPMVTQGLAAEMPCHLFLLSSSMKKAMSLSACLELSSRRFSVLKDCARKGSDSPQKRCSRARISALVSLASWVVQDWSDTPLQIPQPQMQSRTGPVLGSKQVSVTQQRCFQNCGGRQLKWSRSWSKSCTLWFWKSAGWCWRKGLLNCQQLARASRASMRIVRMLQVIIKYGSILVDAQRLEQALVVAALPPRLLLHLHVDDELLHPRVLLGLLAGPVELLELGLVLGRDAQLGLEGLLQPLAQVLLVLLSVDVAPHLDQQPQVVELGGVVVLGPGLLPDTLEEVLDLALGSFEGVLVVLEHLVEEEERVVVALEGHCLHALVGLAAELLALHELEEGLAGQDHHLLQLLGRQLRAQHAQVQLHLQQRVAHLDRSVNCTHLLQALTHNFIIGTHARSCPSACNPSRARTGSTSRSAPARSPSPSQTTTRSNSTDATSSSTSSRRSSKSGK